MANIRLDLELIIDTASVSNARAAYVAETMWALIKNNKISIPIEFVKTKNVKQLATNTVKDCPMCTRNNTLDCGINGFICPTRRIESLVSLTINGVFIDTSIGNIEGICKHLVSVIALYYNIEEKVKCEISEVN